MMKELAQLGVPLMTQGADLLAPWTDDVKAAVMVSPWRGPEGHEICTRRATGEKWVRLPFANEAWWREMEAAR